MPSPKDICFDGRSKWRCVAEEGSSIKPTGVCGEQKLVIDGDHERLVLNKDKSSPSHVLAGTVLAIGDISEDEPRL